MLTGLLTLGLALAARAEALIYFPSNGKILRAANNGAGAHPFISGTQEVFGLATNDTHIFWIHGPGDFTQHHIGRARLDGTQVNQQFIPNAGIHGSGIAVNATHVFWGAGLTIGRANLDGSGRNNAFIGDQGSDVCGVAVNQSWIYVALGTLSRIRRHAINGAFFQNFADVQIPCGVAVGTHLFWANRGGPSIGRAPNQNGLQVDNSFLLYPNGPFDPCAVATDDTHVLWTDGPDIGRARIDGSELDLQFIRDPLARPGVPSTYTGCGLAVDSLSVPANTFKLGKVKLNKKKGTALLTVPTVWPGRVIAAGKGVKRASRRAGVGKVKLLIRAKRKKLRRLNRTGRVRLRVRVTHRPAGGTATSKRKRIRLVKKR
jgi:hypothetical protein